MISASGEQQPVFAPTPFQQRVLAIPEDFDIAWLAGRGVGKDVGAALLIARHIDMYGSAAHALYVRKTNASLLDFEGTCQSIFGALYRGAARYNAQDGIWRYPNQATLRLTHLHERADYDAHQGHSYTLIIVSEATQYASPVLLDLLRSNLRGPIPLRMIWIANPGGSGHGWARRRFIDKRKEWVPYVEEQTGRTTVTVSGTYRDNPHNGDAEGYARNIAGSTRDPELRRAWLTGDFNINRGAYFGQVLDPKRVTVGPFKTVPETHGKRWPTWIGMDHGTKKPAVAVLLCESPGDKIDNVYYPRGSIVALGDCSHHDHDDYGEGLEWTAQRMGEHVVEWLANRWNLKAREAPTYIDAAVYANHGHKGTIAEEYQGAGLSIVASLKGRRAEVLQLLSRLFEDARSLDQPGLCLSTDCDYLWNTLPELQRDPNKPEDTDMHGIDHGCDALMYGVNRPPRCAMSIKMGFASF